MATDSTALSASSDRTRALADFVGRLADAHADPDTVFALRLAQTGLGTLELAPAPAPVIAVVGPTQTGKSTVVNILAGSDQVSASPLAAHTQTAALLTVNVDPAEVGVDGLEAHGLAVQPEPVTDEGPARLIWDTPDFDSNAAAVYRQQVARVCALADLVVVVVSKEKYADQSVWQVLETLSPLRTPTLLCLNKCDDDDETAVLVEAIERRLAGDSRLSGGIAVLTLPMVPGGGAAAQALAMPAVAEFRAEVFRRLAPRTLAQKRTGLARLVRAGWPAWVEPVEQELACRREWQALVGDQARSLLARYRSEYLDHSKHHDVARKAILGLLELLEFPALAKPMAGARHVLTWPFRRLAGAFGQAPDVSRDKELEVLEEAIEHCLITLRGEAAARRHPWWRALETRLAQREPGLRSDLRAEVERYRAEFQPRIDDLSRQLHERLQRSPATLNALRATRLGADAGGIVLAFKTGTLGLYDALFAPAVISVTSYLAESAVGQYLRSVIAGLKREQYQQVSSIVEDNLTRPLESLQPGGAGLFGISDAELQQARAALEEREQ
ncbi:MAG TPA: GTPase domain-containing protein [Arenicellales bacterium]|nr:GTPase domain-containing protein [Arenicellales bacterium]